MPSLQIRDFTPSHIETKRILMNRRVYSIEDPDTGMSLFGAKTPGCILRYIIDSDILLNHNTSTLIVAEYESISTPVPTTVISVKNFVLEQYEVFVTD